jgi:hypothetical protein
MPSAKELADNHVYMLPNGEVGINVTAISGLMDNGKAEGMAGAARYLALNGRDHRAEWDAKRDLGSRVHAHCEAFLRGEGVDCLDGDAGYVDAVESFMADHDPHVLELEEIVLSELGFGGRFDMIVQPLQGKYVGETLLVDLKTGKRHFHEHTLQLAAYRYADGIAVYDEDGSILETRPVPIADRTMCLYVGADGSYGLVEYPADRGAFRAFCALLEAYQWTKQTKGKR